MRVIGIPVADRPECLLALEVAFALGKALNADIQGYHIRPNREESPSISIRNLLHAGVNSAVWPVEAEKVVEATAVSARKLFERMTGEHQYKLSSKYGSVSTPHAVFREKVGSPQKLIPLFGPVNDMLIVSRPAKKGGKKAGIILMSALMHTATPVMVLPQKKIDPGFKRIAIAWNRGRTESMLVHATLPMLMKADDVVLITEGTDYHHGPSAQEMMGFLKAHGISARCRKIQAKDTAKALIKTAREERADILLSGAYTRGRARELIFGGVTEHLLMESDFPVILMHI